MNTQMLYKEFFVWKPIDDKSVLRYRCFEILSNGKLFVLQSDHFSEDSTEKQWNEFNMYFYESISSENFYEQAKEACETIEEAIIKFEADFDEVYEEFNELKDKRTIK